jgi:hypothetical protein
MNVKRLVFAEMAMFLLLAFTPACARSGGQVNVNDPRSPLRLVRTIALPAVRGRIDHMSLDEDHNRLFVAELGNGSVDAVDLATGTVAGRITGLHEPQGLAWLPERQEIVVACGDGSVRFYRGADLKEVADVQLGDDADNIRVDERNGNLVVGYGAGALAVIDPSAHRQLRQLRLPAHPEAFALVGSRVFVNVPQAHAVLVGDLDQPRIIKRLGTGFHSANYPMASDTASARIAVAFRLPGAVSVLNAKSGETIFAVSTCGDADDIYFNAKRLLVVCGDGSVALIAAASPHRAVLVGTRRGARTGLFAPDRNRLFVAVPAHGSPAEVWELAVN